MIVIHVHLPGLERGFSLESLVSKGKKARLTAEDVLEGRARPDVRALLSLIHDVNPSGQGSKKRPGARSPKAGSRTPTPAPTSCWRASPRAQSDNVSRDDATRSTGSRRAREAEAAIVAGALGAARFLVQKAHAEGLDAAHAAGVRAQIAALEARERARAEAELARDPRIALEILAPHRHEGGWRSSAPASRGAPDGLRAQRVSSAASCLRSFAPSNGSVM